MPKLLRCSLLILAGMLVSAVHAQTNDPAVSLAESHWPIGLRLPAALEGQAKPRPKADILVWLPDQTKPIRAFFLVPNNTDLKPMNEHAAMREVARRHQCAIVYLRFAPTGIEAENTQPPDRQVMPSLLDFVAEQTGRAEFRYAPWVAFGKSSRGKFPFRLAWTWPERTIATVVYHGETPTWPAYDWATGLDQSILHLNANGESEWGGTWYNHVRPSLLNYRARTGWLPHVAVAKGVGHGDYEDTHGSKGWGKPAPSGKTSCREIWDYIALFVDKALQLRLPADQFPTKGPIALKKVNAQEGLLLDPFAVEESFQVPQLPLKEGPDGYLLGGTAEPPVSGYAALAPLPGFAAAEGVPVVPLESGKSPRQWLLTDSLKFAMAADPMVELGPLQKLMPKPGDEVTIDGKTLKFAPIQPKQVGPNGGIFLNAGLRPPNGKITLLAATVLEVAERKAYMVQAGYTAATRIQLVLNGQPVRHKQVVELAPGRYPLLVVLRMTANWDRIEPSLAEVPAELVAQAKQMQVEADKYAAELAKLKAAGGPAKPLVRKAAEVPAAEQAKYFWIADQQLAEAWLKLHRR